MTDEIKPRVVDGVGWCDEGCPHVQPGSVLVEELLRCERGPDAKIILCALDDNYRSNTTGEGCCPHHTRRLAAELDDARRRIGVLERTEALDKLRLQSDLEQAEERTAAAEQHASEMTAARDDAKAEVERLREQIMYDAPPCKYCRNSGYPDPEGDVSLQWVCERCGSRWAADDLAALEQK